MTLTDEQCAELSEWSLTRAGGLPLERWPRAVMNYDVTPGNPVRIEGGDVDEVHLHPEDWLSLQRWVDRMDRMAYAATLARAVSIR